MNREQAREIAGKAAESWYAGQIPNTTQYQAVADALHAAYEAERAACPMELHFVCDGPPSHESGRFVELEDGHGRGLGIGDWRKRDDGLWALVVPYGVRESASVDARLASIKETARGLFASRRVVLVNSAFDQAEHFEETFERRYGGKP